MIAKIKISNQFTHVMHLMQYASLITIWRILSFISRGQIRILAEPEM